MWYILENEKQDRDTSGEAEVEWNAREAMDIFDGGLHHKVIVSSWKRCNFSSLWQVVQDSGNNKGNISGRISKVV